MASIAEKFGKHIYRHMNRPEYVRRMLLLAYRFYGLQMHVLPNKLLSPAKQYLGTACMDCMIRPLAHPERQILTSLFTPCEFISAMGLSPMCAEQYSTYVNGACAEQGFVEAAEAAGIAETFCSYHKIVTGAVLSGIMPAPRAIVNTSLACDANNLTFRKAAEHFDVPQIYIDGPDRTDNDSVMYVAEQLRQAAVQLEDITGRKLDEEKLREAVERSRRTVEISKAILPLRRDHYVSTELTSELYESLMMHNALGSPEALRYMTMLREEFEASTIRPGRKILWMHSNPFYQNAAKEIFNYRTDPWIALTEMYCDSMIDMTSDDPYEAMAERTVFNSYNGPVTRRAQSAVKLADMVQPDGIILFCHWGCKETCGASPIIQDALEAAGYPVLVLNGDGVDRKNASDGQTRTRLEAFLEMLGHSQRT